MKLKKGVFHVLVIDDDDFLLSSIKKGLEVRGHKVTISNNVHDAIFKLGMIKPDLILLDIIMPEINGIELMAIINSRFGASGAPIVLMSCLPKKDVLDMGYDLEDVNYITKPFNINQLPVLFEQIA